MARYVIGSMAAAILLLAGCNESAQQAFYKEFRHDGRYYVVGAESSAAKFEAQHHLPLTRTLFGAGPGGETVVLEVDKGNPGYVERLHKTFLDNYYAEMRHDGRIYVVGSPESRAGFAEQHHLPLTRTLFGAGPGGETVVLEVDKKNPGLVERLQKAFFERHPYYAEVEMHGRLFVIGSMDTHEKLLDNGHIPYARTYIGEGPGGKTVVVEVDKKNPELTDKLVRMFNKRHKSDLE